MKNFIISTAVFVALVYLFLKKQNSKRDATNLAPKGTTIKELNIPIIDINNIVEWLFNNKPHEVNSDIVGIVIDLSKADEITELIKSNTIYSVMLKQMKIISKERLLLCYYNKTDSCIIESLPMVVIHGNSFSDGLISQFDNKSLIIIE